MLKVNDKAPQFSLPLIDGGIWQFSGSKTSLIVFLETDCPTCRLTIPYLNRIVETLRDEARIIAISQDGEKETRELIEQMGVKFPVALDSNLDISRQYDLLAVPTLFLINSDGNINHTQIGFDKADLNAIASAMSGSAGCGPLIIADAYDGAPLSKPGCTSRHLELATEGQMAPAVNLYAKRGKRASLIELDDTVDPYEYMMRYDPLPVVPPTVERVERMLAAINLPPDEIIALVPPNYGAATVEKIAANAVMAGCVPEMMNVLATLVRAVCDEKYNIHGVQATTHFAAPLVIINGPVRHRLGFISSGNVFSNVARANSTLGRAFQLILTNIGGARAGEIDMSTLGNAGKFSSCIAENEEQSPWEPLHVEMGLSANLSALSILAAEPPRGVSEHNARHGKQVLEAISRALATVWSYRMCNAVEAIVVLCPEHVKTLHRDGFTKQMVRDWLFENTGIPVRHYDGDGGEGTQYTAVYKETLINGEPCYLKFQSPSAIKIIVAGGTAGKFSAVIGSWAAGPRGSQMVTYPID